MDVKVFQKCIVIPSGVVSFQIADLCMSIPGGSYKNYWHGLGDSPIEHHQLVLLMSHQRNYLENSLQVLVEWNLQQASGRDAIHPMAGREGS